MEPVYEQTVLGNERLLATIGGRGELRFLFYPTKSFPQNIHSSLPGIYRRGRLSWLTDWDSISQRFISPGILETTFSKEDMVVKAIDYVLPNMDVLVRFFEFNIEGDYKFIYYTSPQLWETHIGDAAYYDKGSGSVVVYKRGVVMAVSGSILPDQYQIGQLGAGSDAFVDAYDGELGMNNLSIYEGFKGVNFALLWKLRDTSTLAVYMVFGNDEVEVVRRLQSLKSIDQGLLRHGVMDHWNRWLRLVKDHDPLITYSAYTIKLLQDQGGAIVAAPTIWPDYRYCWPRDAFYSAMAMDVLGYHEDVARFLEWAAKSQGANGAFFQRYYAEPGLKAPSWSFQLDETASIVLAIYVHHRLSGNIQFTRNMWHVVRRAAEYLVSQVDSNGLTMPTVGTWEEHLGVHTYTNAAVSAALAAASYIASELGNLDRSREWAKSAEVVRRVTLESSWNGRFFIKMIKPRWEIPDANTLGLVFPFNLLDPGDDRMRSNVKVLEDSFRYKVGGVGRNSEDKYYGGNPWVITTLWAAIYYKLVGNVDRFSELINWASSHATSTYMLPEQVDKNSGRPLSATPLAWSHAMYILAKLIDEKLYREITPPRVGE